MDIVVTIPKSEYKNDDLETKDMEENDLIQFWSLSRMPKKLNKDDRIYFVKNNKIESSMKVIDIEIGAAKCYTTGRMWSGVNLFMNDLRYENLPFEVRGFQGYRYKWWED